MTDNKMELEKAQRICHEIAREAERWGRHAGFASYHEDEVRRALISCDEAGLFQLVGEKEARVLANRQKGAAEGRAARSQQKVERLEEIIKKQQEMIEAQASRIRTLEDTSKGNA